MKDWHKIGKQAKKQRERLHLSRNEVAENAELSRQTIVDLEGSDSGKRIPAGQLDEVCRQLGITITLGA